MTELKALNLGDLGVGMIGLTPVGGLWLAEAAGVSLENQGHFPGVSLEVLGETSAAFGIHWDGVTGQARRTWNDLEEATEQGACGVAILIVKEISGFSVLEKARKGGGFDYWIGDNESDLPFQGMARLEVSGIQRGTPAQIKRRMAIKLEQTKQSDVTRIPAFVIVVEFGTPVLQFERRQ